MMDKKSLIGLGIIAVILIVWLLNSGPSKEQIARNKHIKDSIELAQQKSMDEQARKLAELAKQKDTLASKSIVLSDSAKLVIKTERFKDFTPASQGTEELVTIENNLLKAYISTKGGRVAKVELKKYNRAESKDPLVLFTGGTSQQSLILDVYGNTRKFITDSFYFKPSEKHIDVTGGKNGQLRLRMETSKPGSYIEYTYSLKDDDYLLGYDVNFTGMQDIISSNTDQVTLRWYQSLPSQEKYITKERDVATAYFKFAIEDDADYINPRKEEEKSLNEAPVKWVSFKQQFFNSTLIADSEFLKDGSFIKTVKTDQTPDIVKDIYAEVGIPYNHGASENFKMKFYFGPNHFYTLKHLDLGMEKMIPTGWSIFSYINKWMVIPIFNYLGGINYGIIILILTIIVKLLLFPIAYKTYMSSAKMRVLKPETEAINSKYKDNADPMKKQQETMALYRRAGVNPLSGCIPILLQFPILIALFNFMPAAIEIRQQSFLWASDLSTYDSIWTFGHVPIINSIYGDHVSLFALLMFGSTIVYTWMNSSMLTPQPNAQMPGMKFMMYFMPVIFLAVMNSYAAGLSWYYFLANVLTFVQTWLMRKFIDDKKIRAGIDANMKKPAKVSKFQKRLEDMQKQQRQIQPAKKK